MKNSENAQAITQLSIDDWFDLVWDDPFVLEDRCCPAKEFTPEQWKELILNDARVFQFEVPEEAVRRLVSRNDFADWDSYRICNALFFGGNWLSDYFPMENITQDDFNFYFGKEAFVDAEEFWDVAPGYFPRGFPPHLKLPYPKPDKKNRSEI